MLGLVPVARSERLVPASFQWRRTNSEGMMDRPHLLETSDYMEMLLYSCSISVLKYSFSSGLLAFKVGVSNPFCMENISLWMWMSLTWQESKKSLWIIKSSRTLHAHSVLAWTTFNIYGKWFYNGKVVFRWLKYSHSGENSYFKNCSLRGEPKISSVALLWKMFILRV